LELLADFIADMAVVGMQLLQFAGEDVNIGSRESPSPIGWERVADRPGEGQPSYNVQYVQRPAALGDGNVFQRFDAKELFADFIRTFYFEFNFANPTIGT